MPIDIEKDSKRKIHRSPGYPAFDLTEAIQKADAVYKAEKRTATSPEVIASHMGYSAAKGPGGRAVSALRQFGLLEESNGGNRISDLGYTLIHYDRNSAEWKRAVVDASVRPTLFKELLDKYTDGLPSDATLKNELLGRGFNPSAIPEVVSIFRNTMSLAGEGQAGYTKPEMPTTIAQGSTATQTKSSQVAPPSFNPAPSMTGVRQDVFSLAEGPVTIQWPASLSPESYQDLGDWLDIVKRKIGRSIKSEETQ